MRVPLCVVFWPLNDLPAGSNELLSQEEKNVAPLKQQQIKTSYLYLGSKLRVVSWNWYQRRLLVESRLGRRGNLLLVPEIADGYGSTDGVLLFIGRMSV